MTELQAHAGELTRIWDGAIHWHCPMARFSTFRVGGPAEAVLIAESRAGLIRTIPWLNQKNIPWQVIGRGSNILVPDQGLAGAVIILGGELAMVTAKPAGRPAIRAGAGASLASLVRQAADSGLCGLEFLVGIPGSVGGALVMNAGAWGDEIGPLVQSLTFLDRSGTARIITRPELNFSYRRWDDRQGKLVLDCDLDLRPGNCEEIMARGREYLGRRKATQPCHQASAGSFFKNPEGDAAGRLIEAAGLKGYAIGGAMVSREHANFIVNTGTATAGEIIALMQEVRSRVLDRFGITLEPEVRILDNQA
ncbi:MAG: UDP-N-acetylmuramate dehydrogenase [Desulfobacterales bacterium]|nr:UDP-N-acetylmuramate dehydrogenase [Desulfobacterales bacterium]